MVEAQSVVGDEELRL